MQHQPRVLSAPAAPANQVAQAIQTGDDRGSATRAVGSSAEKAKPHGGLRTVLIKSELAHVIDVEAVRGTYCGHVTPHSPVGTKPSMSPCGIRN